MVLCGQLDDCRKQLKSLEGAEDYQWIQRLKSMLTNGLDPASSESPLSLFSPSSPWLQPFLEKLAKAPIALLTLAPSTAPPVDETEFCPVHRTRLVNTDVEEEKLSCPHCGYTRTRIDFSVEAPSFDQENSRGAGSPDEQDIETVPKARAPVDRGGQVSVGRAQEASEFRRSGPALPGLPAEKEGPGGRV